MQLTIKKFNFLVAVIFITSISVQCLFAYIDIISFGGMLIVSLMWIPLLACLLSGRKCINLMLVSVKRIDIKWIGIGIFTGFVLLFAEQGSLYFGRLGHLNDQVYFYPYLVSYDHCCRGANGYFSGFPFRGLLERSYLSRAVQFGRDP